MSLTLAGATLGAGVLGATSSALGGIYSANKSAKSAKQANALNAIMAYALQKNQEKFEKWKLANSYQETVKDMQKAGINPILGAVSNGATSAGSIGANFAGAQQGDFSSIASGFEQAGSQLANATARENELRQADTHLNNESKITDTQAAKNIAETTKVQKEAGLIDKFGEKKAQAEISTLQSQTAKTSQETEMLREQAPYILRQQFAKASQELYQKQLSDASSDFLGKYGITRDEAFRLGEDGLELVEKLVQLGLGKAMIKKVINSKEIMNKVKSKKTLKLEELDKLWGK